MTATVVVRRRQVPHETWSFQALEGVLERMRGLLGTSCDAAPVALVGCGSIHTFGMRYRIDVAFLGAGGLVLDVWRSVPPGRVLSSRRAWVALERPHGTGAWFVPGELVDIVRTDDASVGEVDLDAESDACAEGVDSGAGSDARAEPSEPLTASAGVACLHSDAT